MTDTLASALAAYRLALSAAGQRAQVIRRLHDRWAPPTDVVLVHCPYCGEEHRHVLSQDSGLERWSQCDDRPPGRYLIMDGGPERWAAAA